MADTARLRWVAHTELSAAHSSYIVATGAPCADAKTEQLLVGLVTEINNRLLSGSVDVGAFWKHYQTQILRGGEIHQSTTLALAAAGCSELLVEQTAKAIGRGLSDARLSFQKRFPKLDEQLKLRARPLRDRWETVGPGLLREVERQIWDNSPPADWWPAPITVLMLQPARGGDGDVDSEQDAIWIEAVLTDVDPEIPEVLRVAWLITRLAIDSHTRDRSGDQRLSKAWSLVSFPLVLTAAANLELIRGDPLPIERAMRLWHFGTAALANTLSSWWQDFTASSAPLPRALAELEDSLPSTLGRE